jgi:predicted kinase
MTYREPYLVITRGLPASGKTTWAKTWIAEDPDNRARVNRDDLRFALFGRYWPVPEEVVTAAQQAAVRANLLEGRSVVVDDTNLPSRVSRHWYELAEELGAVFDYVDMAADPDECVRRDLARAQAGERSVGEDVIRKMAARFGLPKNRLPHPTLREAAAQPDYRYEGTVLDPTGHVAPSAWLVDVDGTLARMNGRGPFEWHRVGEDEAVEHVVELVQDLAERHAIVVMSGRDEVCRRETEDWLVKHRIPFSALFMRAEGDNRKDSIVKLELFREHVAPWYNVRGVLDDRNQVVEMWRRIGLFCAQVADGDF